MQAPLANHELKACLFDVRRQDLCQSDLFTPLPTTWQMGFRWSSTVAQYTMTGTCLEAGFLSRQFLYDEFAVPPHDVPSVSVATDDVICYERGCVAEMTGGRSSLFNVLDDVWAKHRIVPNVDKCTSRTRCGTALGIDVVNGTGLQPKVS